MTPRRFILFPVLLLFLYLGMYTWNQRTGFMDNLSTSAGLELVGTVLKPVVSAKNTVLDFWERYLDLVGVREENERLKADLIAIQSQLVQAGEDRAELRRLRALLSLPGNRTWRPVGARVVAGRMGPNSALETVMISRGYLTGGAPGTPLMTNQGLVGRVLRASAHNATALLLTDPGSRIAVLSQDTRTPGILTGRGARHQLEVRFVARNAIVREGELLVTSGLDGVYPKGLPVARIVSVAPSDYSQFMSVLATPLVEVEHLEEVLLLEPTGLPPLPDAPEGETFVGPPALHPLPDNQDTPPAGPAASSFVGPLPQAQPAPPTQNRAPAQPQTQQQTRQQDATQGEAPSSRRQGQPAQPGRQGQLETAQTPQEPAESPSNQPAQRRVSDIQGRDAAASSTTPVQSDRGERKTRGERDGQPSTPRTAVPASRSIPQPPLPSQPLQNFQPIQP